MKNIENERHKRTCYFICQELKVQSVILKFIYVKNLNTSHTLKKKTNVHDLIGDYCPCKKSKET